MSKALNSSLTVDFDGIGGGPGGFLKLELPDQAIDPGGPDGIEVWLFPNVPAILQTSFGGLIEPMPMGASGLLDLDNEFITFEGTQRVATEYPSATTVTITKSWANFYRPDGTLIDQLDLSYDASTGEVVASEPCFGACKVSYKADYKRLRYVPQSLPSTAASDGVIYDTILAFHEGSTAKLKVSRTLKDGNKRDYSTCLVVTSAYLLSGMRGYEIPDGWPDSNNQWGKQQFNISPPAKRMSIIADRVHTIIQHDTKLDRLHRRDYTQTLRHPYSVGIPIKKQKKQTPYQLEIGFKITKTYPDVNPPSRLADVKAAIDAKETELKNEYGI